MSTIRAGSLVVLVGAGFTVALTAQQPPAAPPPGTRGAAVVAALKHDTSPALRSLRSAISWAMRVKARFMLEAVKMTLESGISRRPCLGRLGKK